MTTERIRGLISGPLSRTRCAEINNLEILRTACLSLCDEVDRLDQRVADMEKRESVSASTKSGKAVKS